MSLFRNSPPHEIVFRVEKIIGSYSLCNFLMYSGFVFFNITKTPTLALVVNCVVMINV